jgi:hypothetical protein
VPTVRASGVLADASRPSELFVVQADLPGSYGRMVHEPQRALGAHCVRSHGDRSIGGVRGRIQWRRAVSPRFDLTNDTAATVTATDCGQSQALGFIRCKVISRVVLAPGKTGSFGRSKATAGSAPDSLAISGSHGKERCVLIPPTTRPVVLSAAVSDASAAECSVEDLHVPS